jgi:hypothetical protein
MRLPPDAVERIVAAVLRLPRAKSLEELDAALGAAPVR